MAAIERVEQLTIEEYVRLYDREGPFEIIDGERRPLFPYVAIQGLLVSALFGALDNRCRNSNLGQVFANMPFVSITESDWVKGSRIPDIMYFAAARWQQYIGQTPDWQHKPFILVPDLVVEVVSPNDLYTEIQDKVDCYLSDGVSLIWVIDPQRRRVNSYAGSQFTALGETDALTGGEIIPGFTVNLSELFTA